VRGAGRPGRLLYFIFHSTTDATVRRGQADAVGESVARVVGEGYGLCLYFLLKTGHSDAHRGLATQPRSAFSPQTSSPMLLALLLHPVERFARSPCAAAFPRRALLRCSEAEPAAGALSRAQNLESLLSLAVKTERYEEAARLRDELASLGVDTELAVLQANNQFYRSFSDADLQVRATAHMLFLLCAKPQPPPRHPPPPFVCTQCVRSARALSPRASLAGHGRAVGLDHFGLQPPVHTIWLQAMDELWAPEGVVTCTHPGHAPLNGREDIMASWQSILGAGVADQHAKPDPDPDPNQALP
jgi:hypothetical protein